MKNEKSRKGGETKKTERKRKGIKMIYQKKILRKQSSKI